MLLGRIVDEQKRVDVNDFITCYYFCFKDFTVITIWKYVEQFKRPHCIQ